MNSFQVGNAWAKNRGSFMPDCPFCAAPNALEDGTTMNNEPAYVREYKFPISPGHLLIIPERNASDGLSLAYQEQAAITLSGSIILSIRYSPNLLM